MSQFLKNSIVSIVATLGTGVINYGFHFIISRKVSVEEYGIFQSLIAVSAMVGILSSALSNYALRHASVYAATDRKKENAIFINESLKSILYISLGLIVPYSISVPLLGTFLKITNLYGLYIIGIGIYFAFVSVFYFGVLSSWHLFVDMNFYNIIGAVAKLIVGVVIALLIPSGSLLIASFVFNSIFLAFAFQYILKKHGLINRQLKSVSGQNSGQGILEKSFIPVFIFSTLITMLSNVDTLAVKVVGSSELTGYFGAFNMLGKMIFWINGAILTVFIPTVFASSGQGEAVSFKKILQIYAYVVFVGISAVLIYTFFPKLVLGTLFGDKYVGEQSTLSIYGYLGTAFSLYMLEANIAFAQKKNIVSLILTFSVLIIVFGMRFINPNLESIGKFLTTVFFASFFICFIYNHVGRLVTSK